MEVSIGVWKCSWCVQCHQPEQDSIKWVGALHRQRGTKGFELVVAGDERHDFVLYMWLTQA